MVDIISNIGHHRLGRLPAPPVTEIIDGCAGISTRHSSHLFRLVEVWADVHPGRPDFLAALNPMLAHPLVLVSS